jgi:histidine triad (HIT) family protein
MSSVFSKIISGELPSYKIAEDEQFLAFLDINPLAKGHTLVIPKEEEYQNVFDLDDEMIGEYIVFTKKIAKAIKAAIPCIKVGMTVIGLEVPHAHIHLIPINSVSEMNFTRDKMSFSNDEMKELTRKIKAFVQL